MIDSLFLYEYHAHNEEEGASKKKGMIYLKTLISVLASKKLLNIQQETIAKRLEAKEASQLSAKVTCAFSEQAHESGACIPASLGLSEEKIKYMENVFKKQRNTYFNRYNVGWAEHPNFSYRINNVLQPPQKNCPPKGHNNNKQRVNLKEIKSQGMKNTQGQHERTAKDREETHKWSSVAIKNMGSADGTTVY